MSSLRKGNIMARQRMIILYDQSAAWNGLVIGTGNKTEILLGYSTLYGDSACALNPLGDLYKTQVRQLSAAMNIPDIIVTKPPTADLWLGQTDEGELGFTYAEVDQLLYLLIDQRYSPEDCVDAGFDLSFVQKVVERIRRNQFKRVCRRLQNSVTARSATISYTYVIGVLNNHYATSTSLKTQAVPALLDRPDGFNYRFTNAIMGTLLASSNLI